MCNCGSIERESIDERTGSLKISFVDEVHMCVVPSSYESRYLLHDRFSYRAPNAEFSPSYRIGAWDGYIRLYNMFNGKIYRGLLDEVLEFSKGMGWEIEFDGIESTSSSDVILEDVDGWIESLRLPNQPREYQKNVLVDGISSGRRVFVSPTGSGKSLCIYLLTRYHLTKQRRVLIVVPSVSLVRQMTSDFLEYSRSDENFSDEVYQISAGVNKNTTSSVVVSTWQSIVELKSSWLSQFDCVIVDECHGAKAKSFVKILEGMPHCKYRYGFTGTLSNNESKVNELVIQGLLGPSKTVVTTQELIGRDQLSDLEIFCCVFTYPDEVRKAVSKYRYADEKKWICSSRERNAAIVEVVKGLHGGVTLVLFEFVESHGEPLYSMIRESQQSLSEDDGPSREVFFVTGRIPPKKREEIRKIANSDRDCIIVASYGAYAVGINVPNIRNIVLASPTKSYIRLMQSIGRGLRKHGDKDKLLVVDIADNFKWGSKWNTTLDHFEKRVGMYSAQGFSYSVHRVFLNPSCSTCSNF